MSNPTNPQDAAVQDAPARRTSLPVVLALVVCVGLTAFAFWWLSVEADHYDDSDPLAYLGLPIFFGALPGLVLATTAVIARASGKGDPDRWDRIGWLLIAAYTCLAMLLAVLIWWTSRVDDTDTGASSPSPAQLGAGHARG